MTETENNSSVYTGSACSTLETEVLGIHMNTANVKEYIPVGNILSAVQPSKGKDG